MTERFKRSLAGIALLTLGITAVVMAMTILGVISRANADVGGLPADPTGLFLQVYTFIKNGEHLPAVGAALVLFVWGLRWAHTRIPWFGIGDFFKTKLGGYVLGFGTAMLLYLGTALAADQPWTFGLLMQALGTGFAASGKWEGLMDVLKGKNDPGRPTAVARAGTIGVLLLMLLSPTLTGCVRGKQEVKKAGITVLDCTVAELRDLEGLVPSLLPLIGDSPDWDVISAQLDEAGARVGTCVLASLIDRYLSSSRLATPTGSSEAFGALARMKAKYQINAVKTSMGVR